MNNKPWQSGMTLIEIMIALLIGVFLLGGVINIFLDSKQTYRMQEGLSRLQENGRFAMDFIAKDIRMAGFLGCNNKASLVNTCTAANTPSPSCKMPNTLKFGAAYAAPTFLYDFANAIQGFESTSGTAWTPALDTALTGLSPAPLGGSDVITLRRAVEDQSFIVSAHASGTADLTLDTTATLPNAASTANLKAAGFLNSAGTNNCAIAVVSDCSTAAVFQVSGLGTTNNILKHATGGTCVPQNFLADLGTSYVGDQVYPINTISFYVGTNTSGKPSLYRVTGTTVPVELVEGIEKMQVLYGVDRIPLAASAGDQTPDYYIAANNVIAAATASYKAVDWTNVVSVRISLLTVTDDNLTSSPVPYTYGFGNTTPTSPTDHKLRRVFTTTVALRNRLP